MVPPTRIELAYPGRQPGVLTRGLREETEEPPARFELANPAFGGLGPFLLAAARVRSAGFEPAGAALEGRLPIQLGTSALHQGQDSNLQLPFGRR